MKIKNLLLIIAGAAILVSCEKKETTKVELKTQLDSVTYAIGVDVATSLKRQGFEEINGDIFKAGLIENLNEEELLVSLEDVQLILRKYFTKLQEEQAKKMELKKVENLEEGQKFLKKNKKKKGVVETASGLQYEILQEGTGKTPSATDMVKCHYHGTLLDGTVFDSSVERDKPAEFQLNRVIKGWTEGLQLMKEGAKYKFYIPTELAYGENVRPGGKVGPNMALTFEVELIEVMGTPETPAQ
jgi:FKBP-type peptidyl-prolyl cis-trans isomerase FklB